MPPAARLTDMHECPLWNGPIPHVGGPIKSPGEPTVKIGGLISARVTDLCVCVGDGLDPILLGSPTVKIGGELAARMNDMTDHGGKIALGCFTVLIGDVGSGPQSGAMGDAQDTGAPFAQKCPCSGSQ